MKEIDLNIPQGAIFSENRKYRYALWRVWSMNKSPLMFIGLNPSKAGSTTNDPTVIRLMARASRAGFGVLLVANLYSLVSSNPELLLQNDDTIGLETDVYLQQMIDMTNKQGRVLCGWGSFPAAKIRAKQVLSMIQKPYCLGVNSDGQPKHPLYISYDTLIRAFYEANK